jgi:hypothetical protein
MAAAVATHRSNFSDPDFIMTLPEPRTFYHAYLPNRSHGLVL